MNLYNEYTDAINQQFSKPFDNAYKSGDKYKRTKLLSCLSNIHRRWYYSTLIENTFLTPANLFESLNRQYDQSPEVSPNVRIRTQNKYTGLAFESKGYAMDCHPIVADFRTIIDYCQPDIDLTPADTMPEEQAFDVAKRLHMCDPNYAAYLLDLAMEMNLLVKIPSIHANRAQLVRGIEESMNLTDDVMFDKIVLTTLRYAARSLSELIPLQRPLFDEEYLLSILKEPIETDIIFQRLYDTIGIDIEDFSTIGNFFEELDMLDMAVISGTYLLGVLLDKYFLTPFGHYLKLIRPVYMNPFDLENEINIYLGSQIDEDEIGIAFYAPCSRYYLTSMGLSYFNVKPTSSNYMDIEQKLPFSKLEPLFDKDDKNSAKISRKIINIQSLKSIFDRDFFVYSLKVKYLPDPRMWLNIDVSDITSLHRIYVELAYYFDLNKNGEYTFFPDNTENPFAAFASPNQIKRPKKTTEITLGSLLLQEKHIMILSVNYPRKAGIRHKIKLSMEVTKIHKGKSGQSYPAVTRLGKALRENFEW